MVLRANIGECARGFLAYLEVIDCIDSLVFVQTRSSSQIDRSE